MRRWLTVILLLSGALIGWAQQETAKTAPKRPIGLYATLETSLGNIVIRLFEKETPKTVENFVGLATGQKKWRELRSGRVVTGKPFYDGLIFHRVIPNFMVQTGTYLPDGNARLSANIPDEFDPNLKFDRPGRVGMANLGQPNTGNSQFFITYVPTPHLNGKHTVFGQVVEGQEVLAQMAKVKLLPNEMGENARPDPPIRLLKVTLERVGPAPEPARQSPQGVGGPVTKPR